MATYLFLLVLRKYVGRSRMKNDKFTNVAFFHPYCNAGGGGERVLWCAVQALQKKYPLVKIFIYTGDTDASPSEILSKAEQRFNLKLSSDIEFIYLHKRSFVEAANYPHFTILGQSLGSIRLGFEALTAFLPDIYIDTMGYAFTLPLFSLAGCKTASYVHYPTISTDMIETVACRQKTVVNRDRIARNPLLTFGKLFYYEIFATMYKFVGRFSNIIMVNSSWTEYHINSLWQCPMLTYKVFPPCDTRDLQEIPLQRNCNKIKIVSVAQFRKEKDHPMQLKSLYQARRLIPEDVWDLVELVLIGSTRNNEDEVWVQDMRDLAKHFSLENNVTFKINVPYSEMKKELADGRFAARFYPRCAIISN